MRLNCLLFLRFLCYLLFQPNTYHDHSKSLSQLAMNSSQQNLPVKLLFVLGGLLLVGCSSAASTGPVASLAESGALPAADQTAEAVAPVENDSTSEDTSPVEPPARYTVRKAVATAPSIPPVMLSAGHAKLCLVQVGETFPTVNLPRLGGGPTDLASLRGKQATVVLFWHPDRWMARTALIDMQRDVASKFAADQVSVVGVAVRQPAGAVQAALNQAQANFPQLIDTEGKAFATVGTYALPRIYVLDPAGKIVWFDIEYSEGTRRELWQALGVLTKQ